MKKLFCLLLCIFMIFSTFSPAFAHEREVSGVFFPEIKGSVHYVEHSDAPKGAVVYTLEDFIEQYMENIRQFNEQFTINFEGDARNLISYLKEKNNSDIFYGNDYYHWTVKTITWSSQSFENRADITFNITYHHNRAQEQQLDNDVDKLLKEIAGNKKSDYERIKMVNDYIVLQSGYSFSTEASPHSPHTLFYEHKGVCQAYALLGMKMLSKLGIENLHVKGTSGGGDHGWIMVKLDGEWYHLDITHNDPIYSGAYDSSNIVTYNSFLLPTEKMLYGHDSKYDFDVSDYPLANSTKYADKNIGSYNYTEKDWNWLLNKGGETQESDKPKISSEEYNNIINNGISVSNNQTKNDPNYVWTVKLNGAVDKRTLTNANVFAINKNTLELFELNPVQGYDSNEFKAEHKEPFEKNVPYIFVIQNLEGQDGEKMTQIFYMNFVIQ